MRFAARYGLKYPAFASWAARRRKERMGMEEQKAGPMPCAPRRAAVAAKPVRWPEAVTEERRAQLETENRLLRRKADLLARRCFGAKSGSLSPDRPELLLTGSGEPPPGKSGASRAASTAGDTLEAVPPEHAPAAAKPVRRPRLPEHLPIVEEFIDPPEVPAGPGACRRIGGERTGRPDRTPGRFFQRHTVRGKYAGKGAADAVPLTAPLTIPAGPPPGRARPAGAHQPGAAKPSPSSPAWPTSGGTSLRPKRRPPSARAGCCARSNYSIK